MFKIPWKYCYEVCTWQIIPSLHLGIQSCLLEIHWSQLIEGGVSSFVTLHVFVLESQVLHLQVNSPHIEIHSSSLLTKTTKVIKIILFSIMNLETSQKLIIICSALTRWKTAVCKIECYVHQMACCVIFSIVIQLIIEICFRKYHCCTIISNDKYMQEQLHIAVLSTYCFVTKQIELIARLTIFEEH